MKQSQKDQDLLLEIRENFKKCEEYYSEQRAQAKEDFEFRNNKQWPEREKRKREMEGRPCITVNKLDQFVRQVVNNQKINRPQINVKAVDSYADKETSNIFGSIISSIQENSGAENSYDTAFDNACTGGEGYIRVITEYIDDSFDQDIFIKSIDNPFSVYIDPNFKNDFSDLNFAFVFDNMSKAEFKRLYPNSDCYSNNWADNMLDYDWLSKDSIRIAEYFYFEYFEKTLVELENGLVMDMKDYEKLDIQPEILRKRKAQDKKVKWVKTNGYEILESTDFHGKLIPVVPVFADTFIVNGKRVFKGVIRNAKETQLAYNMLRSAEIEQIGLAPKAPFLVAEGQIEGYEDTWDTANTQSYPYLVYKTITANGQAVGAPQRNQFDPAIQTISIAKAGADEDLKAVTGMYDPALGREQKEASGIAIMTKQRQSEASNFLYIDNLSKSLKYLGNVLIGIIPKIYNNERVIRVKGKNGSDDDIITLNSNQKDSAFLEVGKYDINITIGPYGENQRQQATETMSMLMQSNPAIPALISDLYVENLDFEGTKEISERLKFLLPPELQNNKELPPEVQAQIAQAQQEYESQIQGQAQQIEQMKVLISNLTAEKNEVTADLNNKMADILSKERIALLNAKKDIKLKEMDIANKISVNVNKEFEGFLTNTPQIPLQEDTTVIPGVNDPVTEAQAIEAGELTPEEQDDLLAQIGNL